MTDRSKGPRRGKGARPGSPDRPATKSGDRPLRGDGEGPAKRGVGRVNRGPHDDRPERPGDRRKGRPGGVGKPFRSGARPARPRATASDDGLIRLNRYLAQSGVASRREADELIKAGVVTVNGKVVTELGTKVRLGDTVHYGGQRLSMEKKRYVLLNKPKGFITTTDDPRNRRTVMALVDDACPERIYPVGRLDRNTTGVLLLTNDGDLAKKLTHPSHGAEKIYHVTLDKAVTKAHLEQLVSGVPLDDGPAYADEASYVDGTNKREVGVRLHSGRNRVVRRMFEALGYEVVKLDRVVFAGLTKKDLPRGKWRHLTEKEALFLTKRK
jgi:23S rRNA pseudouridine2605 synthase